MIGHFQPFMVLSASQIAFMPASLSPVASPATTSAGEQNNNVRRHGGAG